MIYYNVTNSTIVKKRRFHPWPSQKLWKPQKHHKHRIWRKQGYHIRYCIKLSRIHFVCLCQIHIKHLDISLGWHRLAQVHHTWKFHFTVRSWLSMTDPLVLRSFISETKSGKYSTISWGFYFHKIVQCWGVMAKQFHKYLPNTG